MSAKFTDLNSREHEIVITVAEAMELKKDLGIDLSQIATGDTLDKISGDWETLVNVLCVVCKKSFAEHGLDNEFSVASTLGGDVLENAVSALWEAIGDFFPPLKRQAFRGLIEKAKEVETLASQRMAEEMPKVKAEAILDSMSSNFAGSKPGSSE